MPKNISELSEFWAWSTGNCTSCPNFYVFDLEFGRGSIKSAIYAQKSAYVSWDLGMEAKKHSSAPKEVIILNVIWAWKQEIYDLCPFYKERKWLL